MASSNVENSWSICALAINADATNRKERLKEKKLAAGLEELVRAVQAETDRKLSILTISELDSIEAGKKMAENLKLKCVAEILTGKDKILTAYDTEVWEALDNTTYLSAEGRYLALKLRMKKSGMILLYFSVHLPHKNDKEKAYELLSKAIDDLGKDVDCVMIGGDWNMEPKDIKEKIKPENFEEPALAFAKTDGGTSAAGRTIDNFALLSPKVKLEWRATFSAKKITKEINMEVNGVDEVRNTKEYTEHAPIWVEANFTKVVHENPGTAAKTKARERSPEKSGKQSATNAKETSPEKSGKQSATNAKETSPEKSRKQTMTNTKETDSKNSGNVGKATSRKEKHKSLDEASAKCSGSHES